MGTSKRRIQSKIKDILVNTPVNDLNLRAPQIAEIVLSKKQLSDTFQSEDFTNETISFIYNQFNSFHSSGFNGKSKKEVLEDTISKEEFLNSILEAIEEEFGIDSKILLKALKITMAKFIEVEFDSYSFAQLLFYEVVTQLLITDLQETMKDSYETLTYEEIKKMVSISADSIMNVAVYEKINDFVSKKCNVSDILELIHQRTSEALFGDF
ncbi:hypothetical protein ABFY48_09650 [Lysinibacillus pakistanensis]|uniref:hypothetical protein n=1 Tax=Lysinibacillus pakistanensis TaxID=759811 RepID=UPI003D2E1FB5